MQLNITFSLSDEQAKMVRTALKDQMSEDPCTPFDLLGIGITSVDLPTLTTDVVECSAVCVAVQLAMPLPRINPYLK